MTEILPATSAHISDIQDIAALAWPQAFKDILSASQIAYMMDWMYSEASLREQIEQKNHRYFLAKKDGEFVGYMSIEHNCDDLGKTKIHKIYILPDRQKTGIGKLMLSRAINEAKTANNKAVYLNVNKYNRSAIDFYKRNGFSLVKEEVIDIGNGFVMDDYVFELQLI